MKLCNAYAVCREQGQVALRNKSFSGYQITFKRDNGSVTEEFLYKGTAIAKDEIDPLLYNCMLQNEDWIEEAIAK